jgi:hypothetical protein
LALLTCFIKFPFKKCAVARLPGVIQKNTPASFQAPSNTSLTNQLTIPRHVVCVAGCVIRRHSLSLHSLSSFCFGPNIFLSILLSNTNNFCLIFSVKVQHSDPYTATGLIRALYNFILDFLDISLLWNIFLFARLRLVLKKKIHGAFLQLHLHPEALAFS